MLRWKPTEFGYATMNSNELGPSAPSLPGFILFAVTGLTAIFVLLAMSRAGSRPGAFVIGAAWLRFVMSAFHTFTYRPLVAGMSANALGSLGLFALGLLMIDWRNLALRLLLPIYALILIALASAAVNGAGVVSGLVTVLTKYGYLIVISLSVYEAMRRTKNGSFMTSLLWAFAPLFIFQALSLALGISKHTETDETAASFIGGYNHEAAFSVALAGCLTVVCFTERLSKHVKFSLVVLCVASIFLANYRTTMVAITPLLLAYFGASSLRNFPMRDRPFVLSGVIMLAAIVLGLGSLLLSERFQDVAVAATGNFDFLKRPEHYSVDDTRLLSGRPHIWSMYIYGWLDGDFSNHLIGFGSESWANVFPLYAHNTLVNYLYEYGVIGAIGLLVLWISMLAAALRVQHPQKTVLVGAHASFLLLNMSTMPMWMIEGNLLYGIICGYTFYLLSLQQRRRP